MNTEEPIEIPKLNLNEIPHESVCVFIGKRRTGKSICLKDLLYKHRDIPIGTCISGSETLNKFFSHMMPKKFIHRKFTPDIINKQLNRQQYIADLIEHESNLEKKKKIDSRAFIILDDCLYDKKWLKHEVIRECFMNGRHHNIMLLITMQYPLGIGPELRCNVDYSFIFREPSLVIRKKIYDNYASIIPTFALFNRIMDKCTENYECLVIKNMSLSNRLEDSVFWYKAEIRDNFKIGDDIFWRDQEQKRNDSSDDDIEFSSNKYKKEFSNAKIKKLI